MTEKTTSRARGDGSPKKGELIDERYRVEDVIGRGGMGCIVRARQLTMERDVAIKLLHPHVADDESTVARFKREVHLAKSLTHPNIIQYYDFGSLPDGSLYLVMELLKGHDLHAEIREKGPLSIHRAIDITLQLLDGLAEAHARSVVHRDLKPRNLFLMDRNRRGDFVKILDFGIAKSTQAGQSELTRTGVVCGTPSYLAPELLITQEASPASDLYAVGLILLEMISGRRVFKADTMARTFFMQLRHPVPIPPSLRETALHDFLLYSMAKHPADRFQSADEMIDELEFVLKQMTEDFRLTEDDIVSMAEAISSNSLGMSGIDQMGLDVLRDPAWALTPTPLPLRAEAGGETIADIAPGEKPTVPDRRSLGRGDRARGGGHPQTDPTRAALSSSERSSRSGRSPQKPSHRRGRRRQKLRARSAADATTEGPAANGSAASSSRTKLFVVGAITVTLLLAVGIALGANFLDDDRRGDPAQNSMFEAAPTADGFAAERDDDASPEVMDFVVDDPTEDDLRRDDPRQNDPTRDDPSLDEDATADREHSGDERSGDAEPASDRERNDLDSQQARSTKNGRLDLDRGLPGADERGDEESPSADETDPETSSASSASSKRSKKRARPKRKRKRSDKRDSKPRQDNQGGSAFDDIMEDNTIMDDDDNDLF